MFTKDRLRVPVSALAVLVLIVGLGEITASAQYAVTNLVASQAGKAKFQDADLINAWGIAYAPGGALGVANAGSGLATFYSAQGVKQSVVITVPAASSKHHGTPTGIVYNGTTDFQITEGGKSGPAKFIFDTIDGTISGWNASVNSKNAIVVVNNSGSASYTGLAIGVYKSHNYIYAANHTENAIEMYDDSFNLVKSFTDPNLPTGSGPFNVQNINGRLYVAYTIPKVGGAVDIFGLGGNLIKTLVAGSSVLSGPWGLALAPKNFGPASGALLVGNLNNGRINAFNAATGKLIGPLMDTNGKIIVESQLWATTFGGGAGKDGKTNQVFFAAGPNNEKAGLFGVISFK
jgi:uncharacterized protein (TIGR03118 family)